MAQTTRAVSVAIGDNNTNSGNITGSFNNIVYKSDEDAQIMHWLSPLEPSNRHQGVRTERLAGVGDWLLETSEFRGWRSGEDGADKAILFCSGNPGVGKTYLSSLVIDSLCDQAGGRGIAVAGLYCDFLAQQEQTITNIMGAILKQLVGKGGIPGYLRAEFQKAKGEFGGRGPLLSGLLRMLKTAIASLPQVFICIDALDECLPKHLPELLKSIRDIVRESPGTRVFFTGRPHVREDIRRYFAKAVVMPISSNRGDIKNYLEMRLDADADPEAMNDDLRADIIRIILEKISDIFLLVSLHMDAILGEVTIFQRREKLKNMTRGNGLSDAYAATLTRLKAQKGNKSVLAMKVLMWVVYSERPLRAEELCHALGVRTGCTYLEPDNVPALRTLVASCLGLVTVEVSSSTIRLVHFTLHEHLAGDPTLFHSPHSTIAEVCLTYLNTACIRDLPVTLPWTPSIAPLLGYASCYWGEHSRKGMTDNVKILALELLNSFDEHISAQILLLHYGGDRFWSLGFHGARGSIGFTALHAASFLGIVEVVEAVLGMEELDATAVDCTGGTALTWAARRGQEGVVKMLLEREDVNPDQADTKFGRTPLAWAAENGSDEIVKMLLEREEVNPNQTDTFCGQTPLSWAAKSGHEGVVKILLEREEVNPDQADIKFGQTPLSCAAENGHERIVKLLLAREDVNPNQADTKYGVTPLSWACVSGHEGIVKMLLEREGVNPGYTDPEYGVTPLYVAAYGGHEGVVKLLLEREEVNPEPADTKHIRTPLWVAAKRGHEGIVKMLLEREEVRPDHADIEYGRTPLWVAAKRGHEEIVKMLLEREEVSPDQADTKYGRTPLWNAAKRGHEGIVKMLLKREEVRPDHADTEDGVTPLYVAALGRHEGVVKMFSERKNVRTAAALNNTIQTLRSLAPPEGLDGTAGILLERDNLNPDTVDRGGQASPPPPTRNGDQFVAETQSRDSDPNTDIANPNGPSATPPADPDQREAELGLNRSAPKSPDSDPSTEPSTLPLHPSMWPLNIWHHSRKTDTHPNNPRSIFSIAFNWSFIIAFLICLLAFLLYIFPSSFLDIFSFHKSSPGDRLP